MNFENVEVVKRANVYFDGRVTSRVILFGNGERKTLGLMLAGEYEFKTQEEELMEVLAGEMEICLMGESSYVTYQEGENFVVPANSGFKIIVPRLADYCCSYKAQK